MMPFFFTIPISRMRPIDADNDKSIPGVAERKQRADAGRGESGQDGQGMDEALIQHAENEIHDDQCRDDQCRSRRKRRLERLRHFPANEG